jgi:hypothetical protein
MLYYIACAVGALIVIKLWCAIARDIREERAAQRIIYDGRTLDV